METVYLFHERTDDVLPIRFDKSQPKSPYYRFSQGHEALPLAVHNKATASPIFTALRTQVTESLHEHTSAWGPVWFNSSWLGTIAGRIMVGTTPWDEWEKHNL